jgi:hypothetical protein
MILYGAHCPYCHFGEIGIDTDRLEIVFNPDRNLPFPCEHLACFDGALDAGRRTASWLWVRGLLPLDDLAYREEDRTVSEYLLDIILDELPNSSLAPPQPYLITGGSARERTRRILSRDEPLLSGCGDPPWWSWCSVDFWAMYAPDPQQFTSILPDLLRRRDRLLRRA